MASQNRQYRTWTSMEESKLVEALLNMVNLGAFKADNGFKSGYFQHIEAKLKESCPNSGILGKPHVESKVKVMKKDWQAVYDMTNSSGFGYDSAKRCVIAEDEVWEAYIKVHKGAAKWKNKILPHYEDLCIIFGKDRAQGDKAKYFVELEEQVNLEKQEHLDDYFVELEEEVKNQEASSVNNKKRKSRVDLMVEGFNNAVVYLGEDNLEKMSSMMTKREDEDEKKRDMVTVELEKMESLTLEERFKAIMKMREDRETVNTFWKLTEANREAFVKYILKD